MRWAAIESIAGKIGCKGADAVDVGSQDRTCDDGGGSQRAGLCAAAGVGERGVAVICASAVPRRRGINAPRLCRRRRAALGRTGYLRVFYFPAFCFGAARFVPVVALVRLSPILAEAFAFVEGFALVELSAAVTAHVPHAMSCSWSSSTSTGTL